MSDTSDQIYYALREIAVQAAENKRDQIAHALTSPELSRAERRRLQGQLREVNQKLVDLRQGGEEE